MNDENKFDEYIQLADKAVEDNYTLKAVGYYKKALEIKEISSDNYVGLAYCYSTNCMIEEADNFYNKALALDSTNKRALRGYAGFLFYEKSEYAKSEKQYHKLLKQYPDRGSYIDFSYIFEGVYEDWAPGWAPDCDTSISFLKEGIKKFKDEESLLLAAINLYILSNKLDGARIFFNKLLKDGELTEYIYSQNTSLFRTNNNVDLLIRILNECIANNPSKVWCYKELIKLHSESDNFNLVITTYQKLFNIDYDNIDNYYGLAKYLLQKEKLNKATKYYKIAANINYSKVIFEQAFAFSSPPFNHYIKAIDLYKEVIKLNPNNFRVSTQS